MFEGFFWFTLLHFVIFHIGKTRAEAFSFTARDSYLATPVLKTLLVEDWLGCTLACQDDAMCISYNYDTSFKSCDLNEHGIQPPYTGSDELLKMQGMIFHQIREAKKPLPPREVQPSSQCDCSCTSESACRPGEGSYHRLPESCKEIWENSRVRVDGSYCIRANSSAKYANVFCHMTPIHGCGDGGWTLVMKIDGHKQTFSYSSEYWNNTIAYNEAAGTTLYDVETKLSSFWSTPFNRLCLGMKYPKNGDTNWIALNYNGSSLRDVIGNGAFQATNVSAAEWKKLLNNSEIQEGCQIQGFNSINKGFYFDKDAKARIGIIGCPVNCDQSAQSRIGFGTEGKYFGMDNSNSCGNELKGQGGNPTSIKAFGYIFVQ